MLIITYVTPNGITTVPCILLAILHWERVKEDGSSEEDYLCLIGHLEGNLYLYNITFCREKSLSNAI